MRVPKDIAQVCADTDTPLDDMLRFLEDTLLDAVRAMGAFPRRIIGGSDLWAMERLVKQGKVARHKYGGKVFYSLKVPGQKA